MPTPTAERLRELAEYIRNLHGCPRDGLDDAADALELLAGLLPHWHGIVEWHDHRGLWDVEAEEHLVAGRNLLAEP